MACNTPIKHWKRSELEKLHTKQLLQWSYRSGGTGMLDYGCSPDYCKECVICFETIRQNKALVKEILATREHVLNKQESKAFRKQKIRQGVQYA